jgi:hypothetical protein
MEDDEVEKHPELGRKALDNRRQSMEGGLAREVIQNTLRNPKHKKKNFKTQSPKRGSNIPKGKHGGVNAPSARTGAGKPSMRTATDMTHNPKPRQGEGKPVPVKETQGDKTEKKPAKKEGTGGDSPEDPSSSSDDSGSDASGSEASVKSENRGRHTKPKREDYLTNYLQAKQRHF